MSKNNVYVEAVRTVLNNHGGGPCRSGAVAKEVIEQGLVPAGEYAYHYTLKAAKSSPEFNTTKRGWIALAEVVATDETKEVPQEVGGDFVDFDESVM